MYALTCDSRLVRYRHYQISRVRFAGCDDRQGRVGPGCVAATSAAPCGRSEIGFPAAGSSAESVTGGRKLARYDSGNHYLWRSLSALAQSLEPVDRQRILRLSCRSMASLRNKRQLTVEWGHCDPAGIVFNPRFFEYFDWGTWGLLEAALGVKAHELASTYGIMGIPLVDAGAKFLGPAKFGDVVELTSWVSEFRRSSFDVIHELRVHGALAVEGKETRVWAIREASDPMKIKSQPIPPEVI